MSECTVRGPLAIMLHISRALGLAPLHLARVRGGYMATISRPIAVYGYIFTFCTHLCGIILAFLEIYNSYKWGTMFPVGDFLIRLIILIISGIESYGSVGRMKWMISHLVLLDKINYDVNGDFDIKRNKKIVITIRTFIILWVALHIITKYFSFQTNNVLIEVCNTIFVIEHYKMLLLEMENVLISFDVYCIVQTMSIKLKTVTDEINSDDITPATRYLVSKSIQDLSKSYVSICGLVMGLNAARGFILYTLFSSAVLILMFTACNLIDNLTLLSGGTDQYIFTTLNFLWCSIHVFKTLLFIEPWHRIKEEVTEIRTLLTRLMYNVTPVGESIPLQLDLMFKQLLLNEPTMSPLQMFTFQRSLLITAVGFVNTYFVLLIQCIKNRWNR